MDQKEFIAKYPKSALLLQKVLEIQQIALAAKKENPELGYFIIASICAESEDGIDTINVYKADNVLNNVMSGVMGEAAEYFNIPKEEEK